MIFNVKFMLKNWFNWDRKSFICFFIRVPAVVLQPITMSYIPKLIIDCINGQVNIQNFILIIGTLSLVLALLMWVDPFMHELIIGGMKILRMRYAIMAFTKNLYAPYAELESSLGREKNQRAEDFYRSYQSGSSQFSEILNQICVCIVGIVLSIVLIYKIDLTIIILIIITCVLEYLLLFFLNNKESKLYDKLSKINVKFNYFYSESKNFQSAKDIRLYRFSSMFISSLSKLVKDCEYAIASFSKVNFSVSSTRAVLNLFRDIVAYSYLTFLALNEKITVSNFIFYFGIITGFSNWIISLVYSSADMRKCCDDCKKFREFVDNSDCCKTKALHNAEITSLEFNNVSFAYPKSETNTIKNISFKINKGEKIAIVGENGAGKTTIVKLLCGLYEPSLGEILINGNNLISPSLFSTVFQEYTFLPMTIAENVAAEKNYSEKRLYNALNKAGILEKVKTLENKEKTYLIKEVNENAVDFSGGELQKLLLAKAIYKDAPILILDEPTAAMDPISENELYLKYNEISKDKISFFISHRLSSTRFCDRIFFVSNGEIVEVGTHDELMALKGKYFKMYNLQSYYYKEQEKEYE